MKMVQTKLACEHSRLICWLPVDKRVKVGSVISIDKDPRRWLVMDQYLILERDEIKHDWQVGGLRKVTDRI